MFIYFNENKCAYHKGQLAPFFIVFIIVVIIAALVTINIGKVAKTKTYSANSVDAGVLAAASTMASAFNYIAVSNSHMITNYEYFAAAATVSFVIGYIALTSAMTMTALGIVELVVAEVCQNCCGFWPCCVCWGVSCLLAIGSLTAATGSAALFTQTMVSLIVMVTGYWLLQYSFYRMIRENIDDYYQSSLETGYNFAFNNSGVSSKLKGCRLGSTALCDPCEDACDPDCDGRCGDRENYDDDDKEDYDNCMDACTREQLNCLIGNCQSQRAEYQLWLKDNTNEVSNQSILTYRWLDGQERSHDVATQVAIAPVDEYVLRHTVLPFPAEVALLGVALAAGMSVTTELKAAIAMACVKPVVAAGSAGLAEGSEITGLIVSAIAHAGLIVNGTVTSSDSTGTDAWPYLLCWIDSVPHSRLVDVYQTQRHQGADLGVWSTEYPLTTSSARASFLGQGDIYGPDPYHDAGLTLTDFLSIHLLPELVEPIKDVEGELEE